MTPGAAAPRGPAAHGAPTTIDRVVRERSIVICCGSGGVGKTTTAASFALQAARLGRRACVVTIDPARRLADSLGLDALTNQPTRIEGPWPGELHALMLDPKGTFDDLVQRYSDSAEQAEDIKVNRIYANLTGTLSGTQEYMAMEKLYELVEEGGFDLVVVDTPPTRNALDFLDAPRRLTHFLENRLFQALMKPTRAGLKFMGVAAQALLRTIAKVAGADIVRDAVDLLPGLRGHGGGLPHPGGPGARAAGPGGHVVRAGGLAPSRLGGRGGPLRRQAGRVGHVGHRPGGQPGPAPVRRRRPAGPAAPPGRAARGPAASTELIDNLGGYTAASDREEQAFADLVAQVAPAPVYRVPLLNGDVHDLAGLGAIADLLFVTDGPERAGAAVPVGRLRRSANLWPCAPSSWPATPRRSGPRWRPSPVGRT